MLLQVPRYQFLKTQALPIFINNLKRSKASTIIVLHGKVGIGFVIRNNSEKYKTEVSEMLDNALKDIKFFVCIHLEYYCGVF